MNQQEKELEYLIPIDSLKKFNWKFEKFIICICCEKICKKTRKNQITCQSELCKLSRKRFTANRYRKHKLKENPHYFREATKRHLERLKKNRVISNKIRKNKRLCHVIIEKENRICGKPLPTGYRYMCPACQKRLSTSYDFDTVIAVGA